MKTKRQNIPRMLVSASQRGITGVQRIQKGNRRHGEENRRHPGARRWEAKAEKELSSYLRGRGRSFSTPCDLQGLTPFTSTVLRTTCQIPYGEVRSYRWVAQRVGRPRATRAVGNALARNPVPILIPCHRVVRSDGSLGGYTLGLQMKRTLLEMERNNGFHTKK